MASWTCALCSHTGPLAQTDPRLSEYSADTGLKFLIIFGQAASDFHFARDPTIYIIAPNSSLLQPTSQNKSPFPLDLRIHCLPTNLSMIHPWSSCQAPTGLLDMVLGRVAQQQRAQLSLCCFGLDTPV